MLTKDLKTLLLKYRRRFSKFREDRLKSCVVSIVALVL